MVRAITFIGGKNMLKSKKTIAVLLGVVLVLAISVPALAASSVDFSENTQWGRWEGYLAIIFLLYLK